MRRGSWLCWLVPAVVLLGAQTGAWGDDWSQFRKDAEHSGTSRDPVKLPLTEVWSWTRQYPNAAYYTMNAAVFKGRVFFISREAQQSFLVCADAKTGVVIWKQAWRLARSITTSPVTWLLPWARTVRCTSMTCCRY